MLEPIADLVFYEDIHRYQFQGNWLARSVTQVLSHCHMHTHVHSVRERERDKKLVERSR